MLPRPISEPGDNILVVMRCIDVSEGSPAPLRAGRHIAISDGSAWPQLPHQMRETFAATRVDWSPVGVEVVINGAPSGVLCAERDRSDPTKFAVWFNDLEHWSGSRLAEAAMQYARDVAAEQGGVLAKRSERVIVEFTAL